MDFLPLRHSLLFADLVPPVCVVSVAFVDFGENQFLGLDLVGVDFRYKLLGAVDCVYLCLL